MNSIFTRKKIISTIIVTFIVTIAFVLPIAIPLNEDITIIIGGENFSLTSFVGYLFTNVIFVAIHYLFILVFFKYIIKNNIYKIFLDNKNILLLSMYIVLFNSFIRNSFSFEQFFSIDINYTLRLDILSFFAYSLINSYIIVNINKLIYKSIKNKEIT